MPRRLLLLSALLAATVAPAAHATTAEVCVRQVTLTFSQPVGLSRASGTVTRDHTSICTRVDAAGLPQTVGFHAVSSGVFVGDCTHVEVSGDYSMTVVGGVAGVLYAVSPGYVVADALVLVPDLPCGFTSLTGVETGPGLWP